MRPTARRTDTSLTGTTTSDAAGRSRFRRRQLTDAAHRPGVRRTSLAAALAVVATLAVASATTASASTPATTVGAAAAGVAVSAAPGPTPSPDVTVTVDGDRVTITRDLAQVQRMCARTPAAERRLTDLIDRIQGGADVSGSAAWLEARATAAGAAGHDAAATRLHTRAARRTARVPELQTAVTRIEHAHATVCAAIPAAS